MSKVHLLPSDVISKIAAGEVIERPASAVKELLENSLDAGSAAIEIHIKDAGKELIHIRDNGSGIDKEDLEKIFLRHATSKIAGADDLEHIQSLGFRGEALYSIAAVSDITLRSKTSESDSGWEIHFRGGLPVTAVGGIPLKAVTGGQDNRLSLKPVAMNPGTEIEVRELFCNPPARRKFLNSNTTEMNQILNLVIPYAIFHHPCRFKVTHQDRDVLDVQPSISALSRTAELLNLNEAHILETNYSAPEHNISIRAILGDINIKRSQRDMQFIFINGRPVQNKSIGYHMNQIYQLILPPRSYPFFAVFVDIPTEEIDVNIHPTKREVKIRNEHAISSILRRTCEQALMSRSGAKEAGMPHAGRDESTIAKALMGTHTSELTFENTVPTEMFDGIAGTSRGSTVDQYAFPRSGQRNAGVSEPQDALFHTAAEGLRSKLSRGRFIGSFINKFILFECDRALFVVDQHAAQERISFEKLMTQMEKGTVEVQNLLSPILIKISVQEKLAWEEAKEKFDQLGLSSTLFDNETIGIHTTPILLRNIEPAVRYLLSGENISHCDHESIARRACRSSVMAGDFLNAEKAVFQRGELLKCRDPFTCPHGRPTVIEMNEKYLDKQFLRT